MNKGAVAAGHHLTAEVALEILRAGGNAVDALIASYVASFVTEPCMGSPGGGAFALVSNPDKEPVLFDFFCQTPLSKRPASEYHFIPHIVKFGAEEEVFYFGRGATAVPGAIAGIFALHHHSGSIPIKELFYPGLKLMKEGVALTEFQRYDLGLLEGIICHEKVGKEIFSKDDGQLKGVGDTIYMPLLADYLEVLSIEGAREFYEGYMAHEQDRIFREEGGSIAYEDFKNYKVMIRPPLSVPLGSKRLFCNSLPAMGGAVMAAALDKLWSSPDQNEPGTLEYYKLFAETFAIARDLQLNPQKLAEWTHFQMSKKWGSTSHISIVDKNGLAAALTTTIGEGSGYYDPKSQVIMNNMLGESALLPGGYHSWHPNVRLSSMMNPTIVRGINGDVLSLGSGGAGRIPYVLAQVCWNFFTSNMSLREAVNYPRMHYDGKFFQVEKTGGHLPEELIGIPTKLWNDFSLYFGGVHAVSRNSKGETEAIGDFRREGAWGFE